MLAHFPLFVHLLLAALLLPHRLPHVHAARVRQPSSLVPPALLRQPTPRAPPAFNLNSGGPVDARFNLPDHPWLVGYTSTFSDPSAVIGGAERRNLPMYNSNRFGVAASVWGYDIPVEQPGLYNCTAHFAELNFAAFDPANRVFNLIMATAVAAPVVFNSIDISREQPEFTVVTKTALDLPISGVLSVRLVPIVGDATLSGLTCQRGADLPPSVQLDDIIPQVPVPPPRNPTQPDIPDIPDIPANPSLGPDISINCGGPQVGRFRLEDPAWISGDTSTFDLSGPPIDNADPQNLPALSSHRYGVQSSKFSYIIPRVQRGVYECLLHFAETHEPSFRVGARVFGIYIMDQTLENFDVYAEAGSAEFTSLVKTFVNLSIESVLNITLSPQVGDPFISAITCTKTADLPDASAASATPDVSLEPSPGHEPTINVAESAQPTPTPMPMPTVTVTVTFTVEPSVEPELMPTASPPVIDTSFAPSPSVEPSDAVVWTPLAEPTAELPQVTNSEQPLALAAVDAKPTVPDGSKARTYFLTLTVGANGMFTDAMKDALKKVSLQSSDVVSEWALTGLNDSSTAVVRSLFWIRQSSDDSQSYDAELQAVYVEDDEEDAYEEYKSFINDGNATKAMSSEGYANVEIKLQNLAVTPGGVPEESDSSVIVVVTVASLLVALIVVAVVVFFVVNRRNRFTGDFDAPPPAMSDSDLSSVLDQSETGNSMEFLDDDSTYTAATSRMGEHVDQVAFVKDLFGRGTAEAGSSGVPGPS